MSTESPKHFSEASNWRKDDFINESYIPSPRLAVEGTTPGD